MPSCGRAFRSNTGANSSACSRAATAAEPKASTSSGCPRSAADKRHLSQARSDAHRSRFELHFCSVGTGDAALQINGVAVPVYPNGSFMGWLPVPSDSSPHYELLARNPTQSARLIVPVRIPPVPDTTHREKAVGDTLKPTPSPDTLLPIPGNVYV